MKFRPFIAALALICAGVAACGSGSVSRLFVAPEALAENAVKIDTSAAAAGGATAAKKTGPEPVLALLEKADPVKGAKIAKACAACHTFDKGGKNGIGPNLYGVVGRKKQSTPGFAYSGALTAQGGDVWTYKEISHFIYKPKDYAAGTKMTYAGLKKTQDRADVISYLRTLSDSPAPLPSAADIAAEQGDSGEPAAATPAPEAEPKK